MSFDEQPDGDIHGECAAEIHQLEATIATLRQQLADEAKAAEEKCHKFFQRVVTLENELAAAESRQQEAVAEALRVAAEKCEAHYRDWLGVDGIRAETALDCSHLVLALTTPDLLAQVEVDKRDAKRMDFVCTLEGQLFIARLPGGLPPNNIRCCIDAVIDAARKEAK